MVKFTNETPRQEVVINGNQYTIPAPYEAGHTLTDNEARVLNQILKENARNNFAPKCKKGEVAPSQDEFDAYVAAYEFGVRSIPSSDPVTKEMKKIAEELISKALLRAGTSKKKVGKDAFDAKIEELLSNPETEAKIRAKAEKIIEAKAFALDLD